LEEEKPAVAAFLSFWFFFFLCECLRKSGKLARRQAPQGRITNIYPDHSMVEPEFRIRPEPKTINAYSDVVLRGLSIRAARVGGEQ
jgi:hypothetical protein